ncbi:MAG: hypothetical protein HFF50_02730 [Lawsonibacter sp.]|nr:hypothetical protein [Lawsonibacter sp.]
MSRGNGGSGTSPWGRVALAFLIPLIGLALCEAANDRDPENAPYIRAATLAGFVLYLAAFGIRFLF